MTSTSWKPSYSIEIEGLVAHKHKLEAENARLRAALAESCIEQRGMKYESVGGCERAMAAEAEIARLKKECLVFMTANEEKIEEIERLRAMLDRIGRHPHATGEIRRYAGDALKRVYNADGEIACGDTP